MIYRATQIVYDALIEDNFKCSIREGESSSTVVAGVNGDNCTFDVLFISQDNENDVSVRIYDLCRFKAKMEKMAARGAGRAVSLFTD